jgi:hypothetical protein
VRGWMDQYDHKLLSGQPSKLHVRDAEQRKDDGVEKQREPLKAHEYIPFRRKLDE